MGQKVPPTGQRIGVTEPWRSRWYATKKEFGKFLIEDQKIRQYIKKEFDFAGISKIEIERIGEEVKIIIHTARPGLIIGRKGAKIEELGKEISQLCGGKSVDIDIKEILNPEMDAQIVAKAIAEQLEKRTPHRRLMHRYVEMIMSMGALGVKIQVKGRIGGAEIARGETISIGKIPLAKLMAQIDYGTATAVLTKGTIGVKVWIYKGDKSPEAPILPSP
jgi:small subunit ribosomal protein S3